MSESFTFEALSKRSAEGTITPEGNAWLIGYDHGRTHANYVDAYGGDMDPEPESTPGYIPEENVTLYTAGYMQGIEEWKQEQRED